MIGGRPKAWIERDGDRFFVVAESNIVPDTAFRRSEEFVLQRAAIDFATGEGYAVKSGKCTLPVLKKGWKL